MAEDVDGVWARVLACGGHVKIMRLLESRKKIRIRLVGMIEQGESTTIISGT